MFDKLKGLFNKKIHVRFIDVETGNVFAVADMLPGQLPKSFEAHTTMHLQDEDWEVVEAKPITSDEFIKSGYLKLVLRKIEIKTVDPRELLFSLPTISNELPPIQEGSTKLNKRVFEIREDDWRQIDIIPENNLELINENLKAIKNIYENCSIQNGDFIAFKELHVRRGLDFPFENHNIEKQILMDEFKVNYIYEGVSFNGIAGVIEGGFAFEVCKGVVLYGREVNKLVHSLSLYVKDEESFESNVDDIMEVLKSQKLCLIDWCRMKLY
ncbi:hypothetical protein [Acetivibrio clariflavus]|uniref:Uncharacterized protein n=1 Tax=Acetivibrio clariflavus (strain DSM 19732 / NBRC 101661 / EBR45) TaxID=720554 RepID=G8LWR5_ACECE|nr:hypothetical protein [Acetivibrio clariflavus]AEV69776.1 hypothetical protein Clocl_3261 [Acetivibrio clariflavus DSM 19732]